MREVREIRGKIDAQLPCAVPMIFLAVLVCTGLSAPPARAAEWTHPYRFVPGQSTITQTGGIAGINRTYTISGTFVLAEDWAAHTARFVHVDARAVDDTPEQHTLDVNDVFNMTELSGVWIDGVGYRFNGIAHDGSSILVTLTFSGQGKVVLKGETTPPPNSADFFVFSMDTQAALAGVTFGYTFRPGQSTLTQTGGIAGINRTYTVSGTFLLTDYWDTKTVRFDVVDAKAVDDSPEQHTLDLKEVFNMTELSSTILNSATTRFDGTTRDGSSVRLTLTELPDDTFALKGETTPPPNSADFFIFALDAQAVPAVQTSTYVFDPNRSTVLKTGGFAGVNISYSVKGRFQLTVDSGAGGALFGQVDAKLIDEKGNVYGLSLNEIFNLTGLSCDPNAPLAFAFGGKSADGTESDVRLTLILNNGSARLVGGTTPPPNSADMFFHSLDAVALRKYAGGTGEPNTPYQIATAADLIALGETPEDYDKHFILTADIDLDPNLPGRRVFNKAVIAPVAHMFNNAFGVPFAGVFDGNHHMISHLNIQGESNLGLCGDLAFGAVVKNLGIVGANVVGSGAILVGWSSGGIVARCYSTGVISGGWSAAGLVGCNYGDDWGAGSVTQCYSNAVVSATGGPVGGLVGSNGGNDMGNGIVSQCHSTGEVSGEDQVGGLVGFNHGTVTQCYTTGAVSGGSYVGGLLGWNSGTLSQCYSAGSVNGVSRVGGMVGFTQGTADVCFWDIQTSGQTTSAGGTGKTTAEMQTAKTFLDAGWDFVGEKANGIEDIWWILEGKDYPRLRWEAAGKPHQAFLSAVSK